MSVRWAKTGVSNSIDSVSFINADPKGKHTKHRDDICLSLAEILLQAS